MQNFLQDSEEKVSGPETQTRIEGSPENYRRVSEFRQRFRKWMDPSRDDAPILSGFGRLDKLLCNGLHPELMILGGATGAGKTSFAMQIANNIAAQQQHVLFFSLEISEEVLIAKSISRLSQITDPARSFTVTELMYNKRFRLDDPVREAHYRELENRYFQEIYPYLFIYEGDFGMKAAKIGDTVAEHVKTYGEKPVVFIDYIQLLQSDPGKSEKQVMDDVIYQLKLISRDYEVPVIGLSSLHRTYSSKKTNQKDVNINSFKESGSIEYTAELLFGFQQVETDSVFSMPKIKLDLLKSRHSASGSSLYFDYDSAYSLFIESEAPVIKDPK